MQKLCCVRTRQQFSASLDYFCHQLTIISPSILNHFWWELYHQVGERNTAISAQALRFDQMQLGHTAPTLAEQDTLCTKEVPMPQSIYELGTQLGCTSVVLDVVLGDTSPLATTLRNFCTLAHGGLSACNGGGPYACPPLHAMMGAAADGCLLLRHQHSSPSAASPLRVPP